MRNKLQIYGLVSVWVVCVASGVMAQDSASLDELLDLAPPEVSPEVSLKPSPQELPGAGELSDALLRDLEEGGAANLFEQAIGQMQDVSVRLGRSYDPGLDTQRQMESILEKLDQVIEHAKQQQSNASSSEGGGSGGEPGPQGQSDEVAPQSSPGVEAGQPGPSHGKSTNPSDSKASRGSASPAQPDTRPMESLQREWGDLPPRLRDELREGLVEKFSPIYQQLTEAYYRKLAEQQ